jgi:hypothetical protein
LKKADEKHDPPQVKTWGGLFFGERVEGKGMAGGAE